MNTEDMKPKLLINFPHTQSAHCESGVVSNLLSHKGINVSEAMAFGIGGGLFFGYLPFIRINRLPLVTYRSAAGQILNRFAEIPGIIMYQKKFRSRKQAMEELDATLTDGIPVGLQTGVFWLPYFPKALRFHFNAHNLVVYGKEGDEYLISDPVFPEPVRCPAEDLARARFASGALAPKGKMYYLTHVPEHFERKPLIIQGIQSVFKMMLTSPFPLIGSFLFPYIGLPAFIVSPNFVEVLLTVFVSSLAVCGFGIFLGMVCSTYEQASTLGSTAVVSAAAIGGVMVPVYAMPPVMQQLSIISPLNWGLTAFHDLLMRGYSFSAVLDDLGRLALFFFLTLLLAWKLARTPG